MSKKRRVNTPPKRTAAAPKKREYGAKDMLFGRENYILMIAGLALIFIGFVLMNGGHMPDNDTWDPSIIYSPMKITVAPILILLGLIVEIVAIFRKEKTVEA